jgi:hypothetical protein
MGPLTTDTSKGIDLPLLQRHFEDGLEDIMRLRKSDSVYSRNELFEQLSDKLMRTMLFNKLSRSEVGSTHPPTDAQAAAMAVPTKFGEFVPIKPVENKVKFLIDIGLDVLNVSVEDAKARDLSILYSFSELYDEYNKCVATQSPFRLPASFFKIIDGCPDETRLLTNIVSAAFLWAPPDLTNWTTIARAQRSLPLDLPRHIPTAPLSFPPVTLVGPAHPQVRLAEGRHHEQGGHQCVGPAQAVARRVGAFAGRKSGRGGGGIRDDEGRRACP